MKIDFDLLVELMKGKIEYCEISDGIKASIPDRPGFKGEGKTKEEAAIDLFSKLIEDDPTISAIALRKQKGLFLQLFFKNLKDILERKDFVVEFPVRLKGKLENYKIPCNKGDLIFYTKYGSVKFWGANLNNLENLKSMDNKEGTHSFLLLLSSNKDGYCIPITQALDLTKCLSVSGSEAKIPEEKLDYKWNFNSQEELIDIIMKQIK